MDMPSNDGFFNFGGFLMITYFVNRKKPPKEQHHTHCHTQCLLFHTCS